MCYYLFFYRLIDNLHLISFILKDCLFDHKGNVIIIRKIEVCHRIKNNAVKERRSIFFILLLYGLIEAIRNRSSSHRQKMCLINCN